MTTRRLALLYGAAFVGVSGAAALSAMGPGLGHDSLPDGVEIRERGTDTVLGGAAAPALLCFVSLTCSHCRDWVREVLPVLADGPVRDGRMRVILREHTMDREGLLGAALLRLQDPSGRPSMRARMSEKGVANALTQAEAGELGADLQRAIRTPEAVFQSILSDMREDVRLYGVRGTPTFVAGRQVVLGSRSARDLTALVLG